MSEQIDNGIKKLIEVLEEARKVPRNYFGLDPTDLDGSLTMDHFLRGVMIALQMFDVIPASYWKAYDIISRQNEYYGFSVHPSMKMRQKGMDIPEVVDEVLRTEIEIWELALEIGKDST